jgi:hypothetical protein
MSIEVMRQALEALNKSSVDTPYGNGFGLQRRADERAHEEAIAALRAAIEQKPVLWYHPVSGRVRFEAAPNWMPLYK